MSGQHQRLLVHIETALGECHVFDNVYSRPSDGLVLGQHRRKLTGIEPAMSCDAGPTLNWNLVGRPTSSVQDTSYASIERMLVNTGDGGGSNTRLIYILTLLLGSFLNYIRDFTNEQYLVRPIS